MFLCSHCGLWDVPRTVRMCRSVHIYTLYTGLVLYGVRILCKVCVYRPIYTHIHVHTLFRVVHAMVQRVCVCRHMDVGICVCTCVYAYVHMCVYVCMHIYSCFIRTWHTNDRNSHCTCIQRIIITNTCYKTAHAHTYNYVQVEITNTRELNSRRRLLATSLVVDFLVCVRVCMFVCMSWLQALMWISWYMCMCMYACMSWLQALMWTSWYVCVYECSYVCMCISLKSSWYMHVYMNVYICVCVPVYVLAIYLKCELPGIKHMPICIQTFTNIPVINCCIWMGVDTCSIWDHTISELTQTQIHAYIHT